MFNLNLSCCNLIPLLLLLSAMGMENRFLPSLQQLFICLKAALLCPVWLVFLKPSHLSLFIPQRSSWSLALQWLFRLHTGGLHLSPNTFLKFPCCILCSWGSLGAAKPCRVGDLKSVEWVGKKLRLCACLWTGPPHHWGCHIPFTHASCSLRKAERVCFAFCSLAE